MSSWLVAVSPCQALEALFFLLILVMCLLPLTYLACNRWIHRDWGGSKRNRHPRFAMRAMFWFVILLIPAHPCSLLKVIVSHLIRLIFLWSSELPQMKFLIFLSMASHTDTGRKVDYIVYTGNAVRTDFAIVILPARVSSLDLHPARRPSRLSKICWKQPN